MLPFGRLGDIVSQRIVFLGLVVFTLFTLFLVHASNIFTVIVLRFFQGLGASMVLSGSMALMAAAYPPMQRSLVSVCTYVGLSTGPEIGGYVTLHFSWRHIFLMPVPIGVNRHAKMTHRRRLPLRWANDAAKAFARFPGVII
ncbi:MAG: MFS transporter [Desulfobulbus sp.]|jgi:MFS family permease|uniref:MFS transporter n=1 Tax=Desulfobulbus sp. TaxID=895 RepID=UPI00283ECCCA|nr:MFS transporter [Desulfobulbus sp.]MDR2549951.1 MFS transporter [Desulfobulbus sp.]